VRERQDEDADRTVEPGAGAAGAGGRHGPYVPADELADEPLLAECSWTDCHGEERPAIGRYALFGVLGRGGMGTVFYGVDPRVDVEVAIKVMARDLQDRQPGMVRRFVQEAQLSARLRSPHIVRVVDVDRDHATGGFYLVMEYVRGESAGEWLERVIGRGKRGAAEIDALDVCIGGTHGLASAHQEGIVHRDVKPDNILIPADEDGRLMYRQSKLADLGLARADDVVQRLTGTIMMLGTPGYAAPEQAKDGRLAKKPADVFTVGTTLYAMLTGTAPFARSNPVQAIFATLHGRCKPVETLRPDVSAPTLALLRKCMEPRPEKRFKDAAALLKALLLCRENLARDHEEEEDTATTVIRLADLPEEGKPAVTPTPDDPSTQAPLDDDELRTARVDLGALDVSKLRADAAAALESKAAAATGRIEVAGAPTGTQITLQGKTDASLSYRGLTDPQGRFVRDDVAAGAYQLSASRPGYRVYAAAVQVPGGGVCTVEIGMRRSDGVLAFTSKPSGALALLDGRALGRTPVLAARAAEGVHELRLQLEGHRDAVLTVELRAEERTDLGEIELRLPPRLDLSDVGADVQLRLRGRTLAHGDRLSHGSHVLTAFRPGFEPQEVRIEVADEPEIRPVLAEWTQSLWPLAADVALWTAATPDERERLARHVERAAPQFSLRGVEDFACGGRELAVALFAHEATGLEFVLVPGGSFSMGSPPEEPGRGADERPHDVSVGPFLLARTPVTQAAWRAVMKAAPSHFEGDDLPVERVSWDAARDFCVRTGLALPTEAEWEYACRAGTRTAYGFGDDPEESGAYAWGVELARGRSRAVATRAPNALGLFDMHGNVWEWCHDRYGEYPFEPQPAPVGPDEGVYRVFRGGSWADVPSDLRSARRGAYRTDYEAWNVGFRPKAALGIVADTAPAEGEEESPEHER
jgi:formylglycine-generating enzyme required for sulfatase activity/serine/threonine protein kinase